MEIFNLDLDQVLDSLHLATDFARKVCQSTPLIRLGADFRQDIELVVSEACTNAILHSGGPYPEKKIRISFMIDQNRLIIEVEDHGTGFDLDRIPLPDFEHHPEHGYGLYIIKEKMDSVSYEKGERGNTLKMTHFLECGNST